MKGIQEKGIKELKSFRNRIYRQHGLERISDSAFKELSTKVNNLIEVAESIEETDHKPYEK